MSMVGLTAKLDSTGKRLAKVRCNQTDRDQNCNTDHACSLHTQSAPAKFVVKKRSAGDGWMHALSDARRTLRALSHLSIDPLGKRSCHVDA